MSKISDIIEAFILEQLEDTEYVTLSRNELANFFSCAPSQINYVLSTRFTIPKGYIIESQRGGGGFIRLVKISLEKDDYINELLTETLNADIDYSTAVMILSNLVKLKILDDTSARILSYAISSKALALPVRIENKQRANILKNVLINYMRER